MAFDGRWQARFDDQETAAGWAREVADTGRLVYVVKTIRIRRELVAVYPEDRAEEGHRLWDEGIDDLHGAASAR